jgi:hypothetical protein
MTRTPLPARRDNATIEVVWVNGRKDDVKFQVTYGLDDAGKVKEVFCTSLKVGTDTAGTINDACIAISKLLQHGETIHEIADSFGENRPEGGDHGPASSPLGAIARAGTVIEDHPVQQPKRQSPLAHGVDGKRND